MGARSPAGRRVCLGLVVFLGVGIGGAETALAASAGCDLLNGGDFDFTAPSNGTFNRQQPYDLFEGERITVTWSGTASLDYLIGTKTVVDTATSVGSRQYKIPRDDTFTFDKVVGVNSTPASVTTTCEAASFLPTDTSSALDLASLLSDQAAPELDRVPGMMDLLDAMFGLNLNEPRPLTLDDPLAEEVVEEEEPAELGDGENVLYFPQAISQYPALRAIGDITRSETAFVGGAMPALGYFGTPTTFSTTAAIGEANGWTFHARIDSAIVQRTFAALNATTATAALSLAGTRRIDDDTGIGVGLKLGAARSVSNIPITVNSAQIGADLMVVQLLGDSLTASGYAGYEFGAHSGTISGVAGSYASHTLKLAGRLQGSHEIGSMLIEPSAFALLTDRYRTAFVDAAAVTNPATNTVALDVTAGARVSTNVSMADSPTRVTPFAGANVLLALRSTTPSDPTDSPAIPYDVLRGQILGGVALTFEAGATASLQASLSVGPRSRALSATGSLSIPIR